MPIDAQLCPPRRIAAYFDEQRPEVCIVDIEVVVVHVDSFVACELESSIHLLALESLRFLLRHTDEDDPVADVALAPTRIGHIVLALFVVELVNRDPISLRHRFDRIAELFRDLAQLLTHEGHQPTRCCQRSDVAVQLQPVQAFHFQRHVSFQQFRDVRHIRNFMPEPGLFSLRLCALARE
jgi:hypothetical protein